jgi:hypothetical protein
LPHGAFIRVSVDRAFQNRQQQFRSLVLLDSIFSTCQSSSNRNPWDGEPLHGGYLTDLILSHGSWRIVLHQFCSQPQRQQARKWMFGRIVVRAQRQTRRQSAMSSQLGSSPQVPSRESSTKYITNTPSKFTFPTSGGRFKTQAVRQWRGMTLRCAAVST